ncbi:hypothetical protein [Paenibacillus sp. FSL K6-2524]|uniref:hypothetical protein n=1 Tax=Paenibacillus sp. FSL K6-2524 TaxID=2954516 RepID=UPI0030FAA84F
MAKKTIDITSKLTNDRPVLKLGEGLEFEVDNGKNTVLGMQEDGGLEQSLELLLGKEAVEKIEALNLSFENYLYVFFAACSAATGEDIKVIEARFQRGRQEV